MNLLYHYRAEHLAPKKRERPDGDTLRVRVDLGMQVERITKIRLYGINAWELSDPRGIAARDALIALWPYGTRCLISTFIDPTDKYGRWIAVVTLADGTTLSDRMVTAGHAIYHDY